MPAYLESLIALGADALIVQDLGLVKLIRQIAPEFPVHASTQMTVSSAEAIQLLRDLRIQRFVLSREMSLSEIGAVKQACPEELEVFVHGALCVSYSGQCLTSESFGGRSANRGQCAQSCRLDFELWVDGAPQNTNGRRYLFSPKDLCGISEVPELVQMGVESLKIEGRLKEPEYVAAASQNYRAARDQAQKTIDMSALEMSFSRGFHSGWLHGVDHQTLVDGRTSSHVGQYLGKIQKHSEHALFLADSPNLALGDGVWIADPLSEQNLGGRIYGLKAQGSGLWIDMGRDFRMTSNIAGWNVYRNDAPAVEKEIRQIWKDRDRRRKIQISILARGDLGGNLRLDVQTADGTFVQVCSDFELEKANSQPLDQKLLTEELGALGDSPYALSVLDFRVASGVFARSKQLRELKRLVIDTLNQARIATVGYAVDLEKARFPEAIAPQEVLPSLHLLVRHEAQIEFLQDLPLDSVTMDFEWGKDYKKGLEQIRDFGFKAGIASLRIHKPSENHHLKLIEKLRPEQVLVRNLGALQWLSDKNFVMIGDHGLNVCNSLAYEYFMSKGLLRLMPGHDLNATQFGDLLASVGGNGFEMTLHHYMPTFHMEHCVFAAFLSQGKSWKDCGKPCEKHKVEVRDHKGARHFLRADQECRNTLFNGTPQSSAKFFDQRAEGVLDVMDLGVRNFRIELLDEDRETIRSKVLAYHDLISGKISANELFQKIGVLEKYGVAEGQLFQEMNWSNRKKSAKM